MTRLHQTLGKFISHPQFFVLFVFFIASQESRASIHFTLQSSFIQNNMPLSSQNARSGSASVAIDLGTYFRVGVTHRQAINKTKGYVLNETLGAYLYKMEQYHTFANSVDFTIILYYGRIFIPFLKIGVVKKDYLIVAAQDEKESITNSISIPPVPNGGIGVGIRINRNFSLKLSYTVSPGIRQSHPLLEPESVLDTYSSVGISYNI